MPRHSLMDWISLLSIGLFLAAFGYSLVGHGGASGYLAVMVLCGLSFSEMNPAALTLNIFVSALAWWQFSRANGYSGKLLFPFALTSVPASFFGGTIQADPWVMRSVLGLSLLFAGLWIFRASKTNYEVRIFSFWMALPLGGFLGFISGLVGVGGGIFLSPLLLLTRWGDTRVVAGVSAAFIFFNSAAGLIGHLSSGGVLASELPFWIVLVVVGGGLGSYFGARRLPVFWLRRVLALILVVASQKMFWL